MLNELLIPLLIAAIASVPGIYATWRGMKREDAEADSTVVDTALSLIPALEARIDTLEERAQRQETKIDRQRCTIISLRDRVRDLEFNNHGLYDIAIRLIKQLESNGMNPVVSSVEAEALRNGGNDE